jgi:hypothetical protein
MPLKPEGADNFAEYVTAKPVLSSNSLFVSTFTRSKIVPKIADPCGPLTRTINGYSRIYTLNVTNGGSTGNGNKYIEVDEVKITGLTVVKNGSGSSLLATVDNFTPGGNNLDGVKHHHNELLDVLEIELPGSGGMVNMEPGSNIINYWLRK